MRTIHRSCHRCPFPKPPPLLQATAVTPPRAQANFPHRKGCLTLPSRGATSGRKCYVTPAFSGVPKQGDKIRSGCLTPAFSGDKIRNGTSKKVYVA